MITRSADHRYTFCPAHVLEGSCPIGCVTPKVTVPGVSDIIEPIGASFGAASGWGGKMASQAAVRLVNELPKMIEELGEVGAQRALNSRSNWGPDPSGSILGTDVHDLVSRFLLGEPLPAMTKPQATRVNHFIEWWTASGWKLRLTEAFVLHPPTLGDDWDGWGGTLDILAYDADGRTVLADLKTGSVHAKAVIQTTAYGMCTLVQPHGADKVYPMPIPDRYVILHLTETGLREVELAVGQKERMAFMAALDIFHWQESMKGIKL
jgi:hypothetical protein